MLYEVITLIGVVAAELERRVGTPAEFQFEAATGHAAGILCRRSGGRVAVRHLAQGVSYNFV